MVKVITYGTYDLLHYGHIRLLERAKALGNYLIVGVTAEDFDKSRGKINVQQSLMERVEAIRATGLADEIVIEEYEGQKIDDIKRYNVDIFTVGSDWKGNFDYLKEYCDVVYLERTEGVSSTEIRKQQHTIRMGLVGESQILSKVERESRFVNGLEIVGVYSERQDDLILQCDQYFDSYGDLLKAVDTIYLISHPERHYDYIREALEAGVHVLCESPLALNKKQYEELYKLAENKNCILMDAIKTAYSTAYARLLVLAKSGAIGKIVSVDATCTSLEKINEDFIQKGWSSIMAWGPTAMLPIIQLLGTNYLKYNIISRFIDKERKFDDFTKVDLIYENAVASIKVGTGVKSEGELIVSGENGYIYVPAPWWKMDYFEVRYENAEENKRYFYQLEGEGIRYMLVVFCKAIATGKQLTYIDRKTSGGICDLLDVFWNRKCLDIGK